MELAALTTGRLTNLQLGELTSRTVTSLSLLGDETFFTFPDFNVGRSMWNDAQPAFLTNLEKSRKDALTDDLGNTDEERVNDYLLVEDIAERGRKSKDAQRRESGETVGLLLDHNKEMIRGERNAKTKGIETVLDRLESPELFLAITLLGLTGSIGNLRRSNDEYKSLVLRRSLGTMKKVVGETQTARGILMARYSRLCRYTEIMHHFYPEEPFYSNVLEILNPIRKEFAEVLAAKDGRLAAERARKVDEIMAQADALKELEAK